MAKHSVKLAQLSNGQRYCERIGVEKQAVTGEEVFELAQRGVRLLAKKSIIFMII